MQPVTRMTLKIIGTISLVACVALFFWGRRGGPDPLLRGGLRLDAILGIADPAAPVLSGAEASVRGEEVYASHDCTDCHLGAPVLRQKRDRKEVGLIRVRKDFGVLQKFLETDERHQSYVMISEKDRSDLVAYLRTLIVK